MIIPKNVTGVNKDGHYKCQQLFMSKKTRAQIIARNLWQCIQRHKNWSGFTSRIKIRTFGELSNRNVQKFDKIAWLLCLEFSSNLLWSALHFSPVRNNCLWLLTQFIFWLIICLKCGPNPTVRKGNTVLYIIAINLTSRRWLWWHISLLHMIRRPISDRHVAD